MRVCHSIMLDIYSCKSMPFVVEAISERVPFTRPQECYNAYEEGVARNSVIPFVSHVE